jgi:phospholipase/carboxylesterase
MITKRRLRPALRAAALVVFLGVAPSTLAQTAPSAAAQGRLTTRRAVPKAVREQPPTGLRALELGSSRTVLIYVPSSYRPDRPAPLLVMLHGAGGSPQRGLIWVMSLADSAGLLLVAPKSLGVTWDVVRGRYGADLALIDRAMAHVLANYAVDTTRLAIGGFSDGATYALSVGITNGDFFSHVVAFSDRKSVV